MKVSIIIPVYKVEDYILECLNSVANQTLTTGIECLLVDDCGEDRSIKIAEHFVETYQGNIKFKILYHKKNKGLSAARNTAIMKAEGIYLFFLDSDDLITPDCMEVLWGVVEKYPNVDIVQPFIYRDGINPKDIPLKKCPSYLDNRRKIRTDLCRSKITDAGCNRLIRTDFVKANSLFFQVGYTQEDTIWVFDIQKHIRSIAFCNKYTYYYRYTPNSIMTSLTRDKEAIDFSKVHNLAIEKLRGRHPDSCEVYYFLQQANRVKNANRDICKEQLSTMQSKLFRGLVEIYDHRLHGKNIFEKVVTELLLRFLCPVISKVGLTTKF